MDDTSEDEPSGEDLRRSAQVGRRQILRSFEGTCLGDDVSWKGCALMRCVAINTAGLGGDMIGWGRAWGKALGNLGADVGALCETRIAHDSQHSCARNGLLEAGYIAISHNVSPPLPGGRARGRGRARGGSPRPVTASSEHGPCAAGVVLAVRKTYVGEWACIEKGPTAEPLLVTWYRHWGR